MVRINSACRVQAARFLPPSTRATAAVHRAKIGDTPSSPGIRFIRARRFVDEGFQRTWGRPSRRRVNCGMLVIYRSAISLASAPDVVAEELYARIALPGSTSRPAAVVGRAKKCRALVPFVIRGFGHEFDRPVVARTPVNMRNDLELPRTLIQKQQVGDTKAACCLACDHVELSSRRQGTCEITATLSS